MDESKNPCFQSVVILGLKTALLEAQDEINRLTKERDETRKKVLQMIQTNGKFQVEVIKSNEVATKIKTELKRVRKELEDYKIKLDDLREENERDRVNWTFKCNELKSLLDIKTELLESLNIKSDKANKDESIDYRASYKMLMKNLKMIVRNRLCFPDHELIEDIRSMMFQVESGKTIISSKYLARKMKSSKNKSDECCDNDEDKNLVCVSDDSKDQILTSSSLSSCFPNEISNYSENLDSVQHDSPTKIEDSCDLNCDTSMSTTLVNEKLTEAYAEHRNESCAGVISSSQDNKNDIDTISDSDSDSTSGFCDGETEVESPANIDLASNPRSTPSPENHTFAMCMPDLLLSSDVEKETPKNRRSFSNNVNDSSTNFKASDSVFISTPKNNIKSPSPQEKNPNSRNEPKVEDILKEMEQMRNVMISPFDDDDLVEMNNCFKRPQPVPSLYRKPVQKKRKSIVNTEDFIPKRSSQLVKRDPCRRKSKSSEISSEICEASDASSSQKIDPRPTNDRNEKEKDSPDKLSRAYKLLNFNITNNLSVCETSSVENSSSSNFTSCFQKPIETTTESLTQLFTKANVRDTIEMEGSFNKISFSQSDTEIAVEDIENTKVASLQCSINDTNHFTNHERAKVSENLHSDTLPSIESVANLCEVTKRICAKEENYVTYEKFIDNKPLETSSSSIDENLQEVSSKGNDETVKGFPSIATSLDAYVSNEKLTLTKDAMNEISVEQPLELSNEDVKELREDNSDSNNEKLAETASNDDESSSKGAELEQVAFNNEPYTQSDSLKNALSENVANVASEIVSLPVQESVDESQRTGITITSNDINVDSRSSVNLENTADKDADLKTSLITKRCKNVSVSKPKAKVTALRKSIAEKNMRKNSSTNFDTTEKEVLEKIPRRGRSKRTLLNLRSEDEIPKTSSIFDPPAENLATSIPKTNSANSESADELCVPEDDIQTNLLDCDSAKEKVSEKVPKKPNRSTKASSDLPNEDPPPKVVGNTNQPEDSSTAKPANSANSENLNKTCIRENKVRTKSLTDCDSTKEKVLEKIPKRRGRSKKVSLELHSENELTITGNTEQPENLSDLKSKTSIDNSENSNESYDPENEIQTNSLINYDSSEEKVLEKVSKKRGRPKKLLSKVRAKSVKSDTTKTTNVRNLRSRKRNVTLQIGHESSATKKTIKKNTTIDPDSAKIKLLENSTRMLRRGRLRKVSSVTKSDPENSSNSVESQCDDFKTTRSGRRWCTVDSREIKQTPNSANSSKTMNNGMERRKRKGKYSDILDSLKTKPKRRKSDQDFIDIEPKQRRGCKRKTSLPIETFDNATQTNWSSSESDVSGNTNDKLEVGTSTEVEPEPAVSLVEPSPQNILQSSPVQMKKPNTLNQLENCNVFAHIESCTNPANCSLSSSCQLVTTSGHHLFHKFINDMSKIIEEKVSSIVLNKTPVFQRENSESVESKRDTMKTCISSFVENVAENSSKITDESEAIPTSISSPTKSESVAKSNEDHSSNLPNSSKIFENNEGSIRKSAKKLNRKLVSNSPNSSMKTENYRKLVSTSRIPMNNAHTVSSAILNEKSEQSSSSESERETDESIRKTNTPSANSIVSRKINLSPEKQRDKTSIPKSTLQTVNSTKSISVRQLTSKMKNKKKSPTKSIFDIEIESSITKLRRKVSPRTSKMSKKFINVDSEDDSPVELCSKIVIPSPRTEETNKHKQAMKTRPKTRYEEETSNSSSLSSHVSELDANVELISQFESVRTPPKVKNLFDSSDDESSTLDAFSIIEEMTSGSLCVLQRQKELVEFSPEKYPSYSLPQNEFVDETQIKDEDDSEDETLIIAEDDQINDSTSDGIEINKFNFHDKNNHYASPAYTKSLTPSGLDYAQLSKQVVNRNVTKFDASFTETRTEIQMENENQTKASIPNPVRFQFYKENVQLENDGATSKSLSPFESIWDTLKSLYVKSSPVGEDNLLIPCYQSITHLAFFYTNKKPDSKKPSFCIEYQKLSDVEILIGKYLKDACENEYMAVKNFKLSVDANPVTISDAVTNMIIKNSTRNLKELKVTLGYLSNLCVDLETDHKDFLSIMQTSIKDRIFSKNWRVEKNTDTNQVTCIIAMSVLFTMLSQRSNDVKSVKSLLLDGLYSWKYRGHPVAYGVLNACPTIFNDASRNCLLTRVILFTLINHSMEHNLNLYKVIEVRDMIGQYYNVKLGDKAAEDYVKEGMLLFNDDTWVDAMVLLCKRKEFSWSYTNVVMKYLMQIINKWKECSFNETILIKTIQALHKILQSCPYRAVSSYNKAKDTRKAAPRFQTFNIDSIINSLSSLLQCSKGSRELRETVAIAICSVSHLNFDLCSKILSTWEPVEGVISNRTLEEMNDVMKRCPVIVSKWMHVLLPKNYKTKRYNNRQNFTARPFERANGDSSPQKKQRQGPSKFHARNSSIREPPKKKSKGKKNRNNREQSDKAET